MKWIDLIDKFFKEILQHVPKSKNRSAIYLRQTLSLFLTLLKIFSSKTAIKSTANGKANFVPIAVPRIACKFYQKI